MFESSTFRNRQASNVLATATWGDIIAFAFPHTTPEGADPAVRPCLVLEAQNRNGTRWLTLAPGSPRDTRVPRYSIRVMDPADRAAAGLTRFTRFISDRSISVPVDHPGFAENPWIGRLSGGPFQRMQSVRARIHAMNDIAAYRWAEALRERSDAVQATLPGLDLVASTRPAA
jgi:hypothetical protein